MQERHHESQHRNYKRPFRKKKNSFHIILVLFSYEKVSHSIVRVMFCPLERFPYKRDYEKKFYFYKSSSPKFGARPIAFNICMQKKLSFIWYPNLQWFCTTHWVYHILFSIPSYFNTQLDMHRTCVVCVCFLLHIKRKLCIHLAYLLFFV